MRVIFAGTPAFAAIALAQLAAAGHDVVLVLTQPDRPAGRGLRLQASPVKELALKHGWPVAQPRSLRLDGKYPDDAAAAAEALLAAQADVMVVAAYGLILPQWALDVPRLGCLNIHASLLPRWRGAAPIHRAIEAGDLETGITIMQMDAGLDTGDMLLREALAIGDDSTARLHDRLADMGGRLIVEALRLAEAGALQPVAQPAEAIVRRIRAFDPFPGAASPLDGEAVKFWAACVQSGAAGEQPGTILAVAPSGIAVAAGHSVVLVTELQRAGGKRLPAADFLRGFDVKAGQVFGL